MMATVSRTAFVQDSADDASRQWRENADGLRERFPKPAQLMDDAEQGVQTLAAYRSSARNAETVHGFPPKEHWRQISSTNLLERIIKEIKRRTNVVGIFPNDRAIIRLVGALANEQWDEWQVTRKHKSQESLQKVRNPVSEQRRLLAEGTDKVA